MNKALELNTRWEHNEFPAGKAGQRGLLIEVTAGKADKEPRKDRPPLNLALVIDRSGSMSGKRLEAARNAAIGICQSLRKHDRLSIVAYDHEILVLLDGVKQNKRGRAEAETAIAALHSRGMTNLGGGWLRGCKCVAEVMERRGLETGHVLLLSDGKCNVGITEPNELARHASAMAQRGVTSSCVGIGHDYSPLQLDAIAESGRGQLHHSDDADEIVDVVLGEFVEMTTVAARSVQLRLKLPQQTRVNQLTRFAEENSANQLVLDLGNLVAGRTRKAAFMVVLDAHDKSERRLDFGATLSWRGEEGELVSTNTDFCLRVVDPDLFDPTAKDRDIAQQIAELWLARMGYEAMILNENHRYREAVNVFVHNDVALEQLIADIEEKERERLRERAKRTRSAVSEEWVGSGKLMALSMSKKFMRSEVDHSGRNPEDWSDRAGD
jgi:Ca-activated chloride channel family protein